jgi:hypothetical protein
VGGVGGAGTGRLIDGDRGGRAGELVPVRDAGRGGSAGDEDDAVTDGRLGGRAGEADGATPVSVPDEGGRAFNIVLGIVIIALGP